MEATLPLPLHLQEFVNRTTELERLQNLLAQPTDQRRDRIVIYEGPSGMGKTMLLSRMEHECSLKQVAFARIDFQGGLFNNYLHILRTIRDRLDATAFSAWTERVNYFYPPAGETRAKVDLNLRFSQPSGSVNISGAESVKVDGDLVAGNKVEIRDLYVNTLRDGSQLEDTRDTLTSVFLDCMRQLCQKRSVVLLFDNLDHEDLDKLTREWVWRQLVMQASQCSGFGVIQVISFISSPEISPEYKPYSRELPLKPLKLEDIEKYLLIRGVKEDVAKGAKYSIASGTDCSPAQVVTAVDKLIDFLEQRS